MNINFSTSVTGLFLSLFGLAALPSVGQANQEKNSHPNVLYIMTDQQSYNMMSCMGNKWLKTPNMDKIATRGTLFEKTYSVNPVCMPSRFSLLTGHYASEVGVKENTSNFNESKVAEIISKDALGNLFRKSGYQTLYSGKTHLYGGGKDLSAYGFQVNNTDPYDGPAIYAEQVLPELAKEDKKQPFFLFLSFLNPHDICYKAGADIRFPEKLPQANARETARLLAVQKSLSPEDYKKQIPPAAKNTAPINGEDPEMVIMDVGSRTWDETQWNLYNWMYHRLTESVDAQIGRVLDALKKSGLEENTIIVFTADHGDMNRAHGLTLKNVLFEECQRVPLIIVGNGIKRNYVDRNTLVCNGLDFLPTICDLAGIAIPDGLPGISLKSYLTGKGEKPQRKYIITEDYNGFQITDGRFKYTIYELPDHPEILTDLKTNPGETINYINDPSCKQIKTTLKNELMSNLTKRGLTPLAENRTLKNIRELEIAGKKGGKKKSNEDE